MPAYIVVDIEITDPQGYEEVKRLTPGVVAAYGGRYLARGGQTGVLSGAWAPPRLVILEFPSLEQARLWESSPEYTALKPARDRSARVNMVLTEGV